MEQRLQGQGERWTWPAILGCALLSGVAALVYEVVWLRHFSISFGTTEEASAAVFGVFVLGLGVGAWACAKGMDRVQRPLRVYAAVELAIAIVTPGVPFLLRFGEDAQVVLFGGGLELAESTDRARSLFYVLAAAVTLIVPTGLMGATLPLLLRSAIVHPEQIGRRTACLYAINTTGAVAGALTAPLLLAHPAVGLRLATLVGAGLNCAAAMIAFAIARKARAPAGHARAAGAGLRARRLGSKGTFLLVLMALSGAAALGNEVLWSRLLTHLIGGSMYAYAITLATFLLGIGAGSLLVARFACASPGAATWFVAAQLAIGVCTSASFEALDALPALAGALNAGEHAFLRNGVVAGAAVLPCTLWMGATFPLAVLLLTREGLEPGTASGRLYAWNSSGAVVGALLAGYVLIPELGFEGTAKLVVLANLLLGLAAAVVLSGGRVATACAVILGSAIALTWRPRPPLTLLHASPFGGARLEGRQVYLGTGRSATVLLLERQGSYAMYINGLPQGATNAAGSPPDPEVRNERLLAALPVLARPRARSMLVIGLGLGETIQGIPPSIQAVDVVELEPEVIEANLRIAAEREDDPLSDPRVRLVTNDARTALLLTSKRYDVIVSQPSHPWSAGASHLFTSEFYGLVREHLRPGGVFSQWFSSSFLDEETFRVLGATLLERFTHVRLYRTAPGFLVFLASDESLDPECRQALTGEPLASAAGHYQRLGIHRAEDLAALLALDRPGVEGLCRGARAATDDRNLVAARSSWNLHRHLNESMIDQLVLAFDPLQEGGVLEACGARLDMADLVRIAGELGACGRAQAIVSRLPPGAERLHAEGLLERTCGNREHETALLEKALKLEPGDQGMRYSLVRPALELIALGTAREQVVECAQLLVGAAAAVVEAQGRSIDEDWLELARLDDRLALARPWDAWYADAVCFRAMWRSHVRCAAEQRRALGAEALDLLDRALVTGYEWRCLLVRLNAARAADRTDAIVGSCEALVRVVTGRNSMPVAHVSPAELSRLQRAVLDAVQGLEGIGPTPWSSRVEELRHALVVVPGGS